MSNISIKIKLYEIESIENAGKNLIWEAPNLI